MKCLGWLLNLFYVLCGVLGTICIAIYLIVRQIFPARLQSVRNKRVLIVKSGSRLGKEIALEFGRHGAIVVCWDPDLRACMATVYAIRHEGGDAIGFQCDCCDPTQVIGMAATTLRAVNSIDILINNAGVYPSKPLQYWDGAELRTLFNINVFAHFWILNAFLPDMVHRASGHVVSVSSTSALSPIPHDVPYAATKGAISCMMEALGEELRRSNVRTTCIFPTFEPSQGTQPVTTRLKTTPHSPRFTAKEIVRAIREGRETYSIPAGTYVYTNLLRCCPQEIRHLWKIILYKNISSDGVHVGVVPDNSTITPDSLHDEQCRVRTTSPRRTAEKRICPGCFADAGPPLKKRFLDWRFDRPSNPKEPLSWKVLSPGPSTSNQVEPCAVYKKCAMTNEALQMKCSVSCTISDSTTTIPDRIKSSDSESEDEEPSWMTHVTNSLATYDWLNKLYEPMSNLAPFTSLWNDNECPFRELESCPTPYQSSSESSNEDDDRILSKPEKVWTCMFYGRDTRIKYSGKGEKTKASEPPLPCGLQSPEIDLDPCKVKSTALILLPHLIGNIYETKHNENVQNRLDKSAQEVYNICDINNIPSVSSEKQQSCEIPDERNIADCNSQTKSKSFLDVECHDGSQETLESKKLDLLYTCHKTERIVGVEQAVEDILKEMVIQTVKTYNNNEGLESSLESNQTSSLHNLNMNDSFTIHGKNYSSIKSKYTFLDSQSLHPVESISASHISCQERTRGDISVGKEKWVSSHSSSHLRYNHDYKQSETRIQLMEMNSPTFMSCSELAETINQLESVSAEDSYSCNLDIEGTGLCLDETSGDKDILIRRAETVIKIEDLNDTNSIETK